MHYLLASTHCALYRNNCGNSFMEEMSLITVKLIPVEQFVLIPPQKCFAGRIWLCDVSCLSTAPYLREVLPIYDVSDESLNICFGKITNHLLHFICSYLTNEQIQCQVPRSPFSATELFLFCFSKHQIGHCYPRSPSAPTGIVVGHCVRPPSVRPSVCLSVCPPRTMLPLFKDFSHQSIIS